MEDIIWNRPSYDQHRKKNVFIVNKAEENLVSYWKVFILQLDKFDQNYITYHTGLVFL